VILLNQRIAMKILAGRIRRQLRLDANKWGHCAVYENELQRVWPLDENNRKAKIEQFAKKKGFRLAYYSHGFCSIFEELPPTRK
jgi:hypothetical protein